MTIETEVAALTDATNALLAVCTLRRDELSGAVTAGSEILTAAAASADAAAASAAAAASTVTAAVAAAAATATAATAASASAAAASAAAAAASAAAAAATTTIGKHAIPIMALAMHPSATGGCANAAVIASAANQPDIATLDFDPTTQEYAQFSIPMPKSWNEGTVTFAPVWSHAATTVNFATVWALQAVAVSNNESIAQNFGAAQYSTDTGGTTNNRYVGPESAAITIAGTPAAEDEVFFRLSRLAADGADTLAIDARLHGIVLYFSTDSGNDA